MKLSEPINSPLQLDNQLKNFNDLLVRAANATNKHKDGVMKAPSYPSHIIMYVHQRRAARHRWQRTRLPSDKTEFNRRNRIVSRKIKEFKNKSFTDFVSCLSHNAKSNFSLWKAAKRICRPAPTNSPLITADSSQIVTDLSKAEHFASHLE